MLLLLQAALAATVLQSQAKAGVTHAALRAAREPVEVGAFNHEGAGWTVTCWGGEKSEVKCAASNGASRRMATTVKYIGETEKNLSLTFAGKDGSEGFMVEISGVNAGY